MNNVSKAASCVVEMKEGRKAVTCEGGRPRDARMEKSLTERNQWTKEGQTCVCIIISRTVS